MDPPSCPACRCMLFNARRSLAALGRGLLSTCIITLAISIVFWVYASVVCAVEQGVRVFDLYLLDDDWALNNANWQWLSCSNFFYQVSSVLQQSILLCMFLCLLIVFQMLFSCCIRKKDRQKWGIHPKVAACSGRRDIFAQPLLN